MNTKSSIRISLRLFVLFLLAGSLQGNSSEIENKNPDKFERDTITTEAGNLEITFIGHGTLMLTFKGMVIHIDPWTKLADYSKLPKADLILITHDHYDHFDLKAIETIQKQDTQIIIPQACTDRVKNGIIMNNGDIKEISTIKIEAFPAYNIIHKRPDGQPFHPKGVGNGYILTFAKTRIYVAGDTENIPEMKDMKKIDIAFLPMNLPYTMTPEMVVDAIRVLQPAILYPYHFGETDPNVLLKSLKDIKKTEVRIRKMK